MIFNFFMCIAVLPECMYVCVRVSITWSWITDSCEVPCGCWELKSDHLGEQPMFLITESSISPTRDDVLKANHQGPFPYSAALSS